MDYTWPTELISHKEWFYPEVGNWPMLWEPDSFDEFFLRTLSINPN